jgi:hypothetical protein
MNAWNIATPAGFDIWRTGDLYSWRTKNMAAAGGPAVEVRARGLVPADAAFMSVLRRLRDLSQRRPS